MDYSGYQDNRDLRYGHPSMVNQNQFNHTNMHDSHYEGHNVYSNTSARGGLIPHSPSKYGNYQQQPSHNFYQDSMRVQHNMNDSIGTPQHRTGTGWTGNSSNNIISSPAGNPQGRTVGLLASLQQQRPQQDRTNDSMRGFSGNESIHRGYSPTKEIPKTPLAKSDHNNRSEDRRGPPIGGKHFGKQGTNNAKRASSMLRHESSVVSPDKFNESTSLGTNESKKCCVTVFGFPPDAPSFVLPEFHACGTIEDRCFKPGCNWIHLRFSSPHEASKALALHRTKFNECMMIAVERCWDQEFIESNKGKSDFEGVFGTPLKKKERARSLLTKPVHEPNSSDPPEKDRGLIGGAFDYIFGL
eukprot:m.73391 g.73391  ORF g.73391 m.73391 type:complete len:356 (+) comp12407_c0_seq2:99-1166(+)